MKNMGGILSLSSSKVQFRTDSTNFVVEQIHEPLLSVEIDIRFRNPQLWVDDKVGL
jgi:hypothetical protein